VFMKFMAKYFVDIIKILASYTGWAKKWHKNLYANNFIKY